MTRFTGTLTLVRLILRRDRVRLPVWVLALVGLTGYSAAAVQGLYDTPQAMATYAATIGSSGASIAMTGPPTALDTIGGITVFEVTPTALIGIALMVVFLVMRHTRTDEEAGRTELLRAGVLGRNADLLATGLVVTAASALVGLGVAATFLASGLPASGSLLYGASVACVGLVFASVALVTAQVSEHGRSATGIALAVLGVAFLLRGIGDVQESWLTWTSPLGWAQAVAAFGDQRWWPLSLTVVLAFALTALGGWLTTRRDVGAGLIAPRPGRPAASRWLGSPLGLAARLQRGSLLGWTAGVTAMGIAFGSLGQDVEDMIEGNEQLEEIFALTSGGASIVDAYFAMTFMITALLATGFTVSAVLRLHTEEAALRAEPLLATPVSRLRWTGTWLAVTAVGTAALLLVAGLGAGTTYALVSGEAGEVLGLAGALLAYLPACLTLGALAFAGFGWLPRAGMVAWAAFTVCVVIGWLGELLGLPGWLMDISPYSRTPQLPIDDLTWAPLLGISLAAALLTGLGAAGFQRRDVATG